MTTFLSLRLTSCWFVGLCLAVLGWTADARAASPLVDHGEVFSATTTPLVTPEIGRNLKVMGDRDYNAFSNDAVLPVALSLDVTRLAAGGGMRVQHFFIKADNTLWAMGNNGFGQLGDGTTTARTAPKQIATDAAQVTAGGEHTLFVKTDGTLWGMGANTCGQLGDGTTTHRATPIQIASAVAQASAGLSHSLFVKTDGSLWAMGSNASGQLGDGTTTGRNQPVQVATGVAQVWAASGFSPEAVGTSLFLKLDGTLWGMGANSGGQLGDGTTSARSLPVLIASDVLSASCGRGHILFIKSDSTLWGLGTNSSGQLGDGTTVAKATPIMIASGVSEVAAGGVHSLFLKIDRTLWSMGSNQYGQLGDGTKVSRSTPVQVGGHIWRIAAGNGHSLFLQTPPPRIITQPASPVLILSGTAATLTITATDAEPFTYQWFRGSRSDTSHPISGATGPTFTTPLLTDAQPYWVRLTNASDFVDSTVASVHIGTAPVFTQEPLSVTINHGSTTTLVSQANGLFIGYQWYIGASGDTSAPVAGATNRQFTTPALTQTRSYWVQATNAVGAADSVAAIVSVRPKITVQPVPTSVPLGETVTLTAAAGGSAPLAYQWYRGASGDLSQPVADEVGFTLTLPAPAEATSYWLQATNPFGTADSVAAEVIGMVAPSVTAQPALIGGGGVSFGGPGIARVGVAGGGMSYQWYRGQPGDTSAPVGGATSALLLTPPLFANATFWVRAWNAVDTVDSAPLTIPVTPARPQALFTTTTNALTTPMRMALDVVQIAAGNRFSLFVKADGTLWGWGDNSSKQLGGNESSYSTPVQIATDVAVVSAGNSHALFLKRDGSLWSTGSNSSGQRGIGDLSGPASPTLVTTGVAQIAAGSFHSLFIKTDGTLWAIGTGSDGQLGVPDLLSSKIPVQVASDVVQIAAGGNHSLFVTSDGTAWGMGRNVDGQLGDGTNTFRRTPVRLITGVASAAAGGNHSLFLKTDGTLWTSGFNPPGALGDGTTVSRNLPVQIATDVAMASGDRNLSTGTGFSLFVKRDGTLWTTGANSSRQLVDGTTISRATPVQVANGLSAASAGAIHSLFLQTPPPVITGYSPEIGILTGQTSTLQVEAASQVSLTYQWFVGVSGNLAQPIPDATAATFDTPALATSATYWVRVTNAFGSIDSPSLTVTVCTPPTVTVTAPGVPMFMGRRATLTANAAGGLLNYQWYRGASGDASAPIPDATEAVLTAPSLAENATFWVRVSNLAGTTDSAAATVHVVTQANLLATGFNYEGQLALGFGVALTPPVTVSPEVARVAAGGAHSLILKTDGTLWAVGRNNSGQLGDGTTTDRLTPVFITNDVIEIAAGTSHSLYVKTDGTLWGMGSSANGQLGNGTTSRSTPILITTGVARVAAGSSHTLFLKTDGILYSCGANASGQLGNGGTSDRSSPVQVATGVTGIAAGNAHSLALKSDDSLWTTGANAAGQLGDGTTTAKSTFAAVAADVAQIAAGGNSTWLVKTDGSLWTVGGGGSGQLADGGAVNRSTPAQVATEVARIALGSNHGLFTKTDSSLWVVGANSWGQLGDGTRETRNVPQPIASGVTQIAAGGSHSLFVTADGALLACGQNIYGQIGNGESGIQLTPRLSASEIVAVAAGDEHTMFIRADNTLWGVGGNSSGQLGDGTRAGRVVPVLIATDVARVTAAGQTTFFIKTDGTLWASGENLHGQLGLGVTSGSVSEPGLVAADVSQVATSGLHTLFIKSDDTLWAMGSNLAGQFGNLEVSSGSNAPIQVASQVRQVAAGSGPIANSGFSAFLKTDGTLWTMGSDRDGQLGDGTSSVNTPGPAVPRQIASEVASISAGPAQLLFVKQDATLWGTGGNSSGALGTGIPITYRSPVQITTDVAQVAAGTHTLILKLDGSLWATGDNLYGQLGDGTTTRRTTPVKVADGILDIAVGGGNLPFGGYSLFLQTPRPEILLPPAPLTVRIGTRAEFAVAMTEGSGPLTYQWRREGVALSNPTATSARLVIENTLTADAGEYDVIVTGASGHVTSERVALVVHTEEHTTYAAWAAANAVSGDALATPADGGASNLLRFAFKLPAHGPAESSPAVQTITEPDGRYLALAFPRKSYAPGLRYVVESSPDLVAWSTVETVLPGLPEAVVVRDSQPLGATPRFLRIRVEMGP